ncbi:prolyl 3-hydroxylase OGFOD1-like isoform X2 [Limulus polyphemus]|uniref:Prolyl 3-hydroxylase OGFOD1-like isoform X2 n=1 Tax=Limulus polyphemus TaxID=6850 RepID=A0ABM1BSR9_LIMPO|nr:prolyl 3-hydroxylase OGFOD1-like isoform X2 [Limulus polyphemus]
MSSATKHHLTQQITEHPRKKIQKSNPETRLNPLIFSEDFKTAIKTAFQRKLELICENGETVLADPFRCCVLPNFIKDDSETFLEALKNELVELKFTEKNNDLYKFHQSGDLKEIETPCIMVLKKLLSENTLEWVKEVTDIPLNNSINIFCSKYQYTDVLLCHDDELEERRIAYILYLVPPWTKSDGGTLDLFNSDSNGQPCKIVKSLLPAWNKFVFFEVTHQSFHQVAEILSEDKTRLSISGWFHGPSIVRPTPVIEPLRELCTPGFVEERVLRAWINPTYLEEETQMQIQKKFQTSSEIELQGFLQEDKYELVAQALRDSNLKWNQKGPANKRNYEDVNILSLPSVVQQCLKVFQSEAMFLTLANMTGLTLHELLAYGDSDTESIDGNTKAFSDVEEKEASYTPCTTSEVVDTKVKHDSSPGQGSSGHSKRTCDPKCRMQVHQWKHGFYTLAHDEDKEMAEYSLDATLFLNCDEWKSEYGGFISYIAKGEDEELLTVYPQSNSLALVYRDHETLRFVKHINHRISQRPSSQQSFNDIFCVYYE